MLNFLPLDHQDLSVTEYLISWGYVTFYNNPMIPGHHHKLFTLTSFLTPSPTPTSPASFCILWNLMLFFIKLSIFTISSLQLILTKTQNFSLSSGFSLPLSNDKFKRSQPALFIALEMLFLQVFLTVYNRYGFFIMDQCLLCRLPGDQDRITLNTIYCEKVLQTTLVMRIFAAHC